MNLRGTFDFVYESQFQFSILFFIIVILRISPHSLANHCSTTIIQSNIIRTASEWSAAPILRSTKMVYFLSFLGFFFFFILLSCSPFQSDFSNAFQSNYLMFIDLLSLRSVSILGLNFIFFFYYRRLFRHDIINLFVFIIINHTLSVVLLSFIYLWLSHEQQRMIIEKEKQALP